MFDHAKARDMRVGLLEDDIAIQEMLSLVLQDEGYTVTNYLRAEQCLDALGTTIQGPMLPPVDLLIVDWHLGGTTSGTQVIQQIRSNPRLSLLPIILTTAATFKHIEALHHWHVCLLQKPFSVDDIALLVKKLTQTCSPIQQT